MNTKILSVLLHVGKIVQTGKDLEAAIGDLTKGNYQKTDVITVLGDVSDLIGDGVIVIPGMTATDAQAAIADLVKSL